MCGGWCVGVGRFEGLSDDGDLQKSIRPVEGEGGDLHKIHEAGCGEGEHLHEIYEAGCG